MRAKRATSRTSLPDYVGPDLDILFVGINPGLRSMAVGHHFAGYSNRFWKLLYGAGLVSEPLGPEDDWRLPQWGIGITNLIRRPTAGVGSLKAEEYAAGRKRLHSLVLQHRPRVIALLGITLLPALFPPRPRKSPESSVPLRPSPGWQPNRFADTRVHLLPNPSGRNAHYSYETMLALFAVLRGATVGKRASRD
ncbi:MAG TPA: mismatch-specific DNA-glycosylase [Nitrospiraceae bacterium]|nr:mismatch-specific DNA-glycosylase [Nitrospiraceae bacterium]